MFVKQIDMAKALELAAKGMEIKVLAPIEMCIRDSTYTEHFGQFCLF